MRNDFLEITCNHRNEFRTTMSFVFRGNEYHDIGVKIDTGCPYTTILTSRLGIPLNEARKMKIADAGDKTIKKELSFGVNDTEEFKAQARKKFSENDVDDLMGVSFIKEVQKIEIGGISLGNMSIKVNYDRIGNMLIGVDILKKWDVHIGESMDSDSKGETVLLACPKDHITPEYRKALGKHFRLTAT